MALGKPLTGLRTDVRERADWCLEVAAYYGVPVTVTSVYRTRAQQEELYENFQACKAAGSYPSAKSYGPGLSCKYPANRPGDSAHEYGLAWDSWVPDDYRAGWRYVRELAGFRVPANDEVHAERPGWREYALA